MSSSTAPPTAPLARPTSSSPRRSTRALVGLALAGLVASAAVPVATAGEREGVRDDDGHGRVVAAGLDSPRHLSVDRRGTVYVAEAGTGGEDCVLGEVPGEPEPVEVCAGTTGAVTAVSRRGHQSRVVTGLPSLRLGTDVIGASDVEPGRRGRLMISVGLGNPPETRDALVEEHGREYRRLATVQEARLRNHGEARLRTEADLARFETRRNPDGGLLDTNPNSLARDGRGWLVADAGANDVLRLGHHDRLRLVTVLPGGTAEFPPGSGGQVPFQPVPTSAVRGPDGAVYVSQLTGFPFPPDGAGIWRVGRDGVARPWATGLTNVTDLAFDHRGRLYAVQLSDVGLLNETGLPSGSLVRVRKGQDEHRTVVDDLEAPFGVALHRGDAYITTCTVCEDGGQVLRFDLDR